MRLNYYFVKIDEAQICTSLSVKCILCATIRTVWWLVKMVY